MNPRDEVAIVSGGNFGLGQRAGLLIRAPLADGEVIRVEDAARREQPGA